MKKELRLLTVFFSLLGMVYMAGCGEDGDVIYNQDTAGIADLSIMATEITEGASDLSNAEYTITFTPNEYTAEFEYFLGRESDRASFMGGTLEGVSERTGSDEYTEEVSGMLRGTEYTVFARAYGAEGNAGGVISVSFVVSGYPTVGNFTITELFIGDISAAVKLNCSAEYIRYDYYLGTAADREAFEAGTLEGISTMTDKSEYTFTYFDLKPDTEYIFYARGYSRYGTDTGVLEYMVGTTPEGESPAVEMDIESIDVHRGEYSFTANQLCSKFVVAFSGEGERDGVFAVTGDIRGAMNRWIETGATIQGYEESNGRTLETVYAQSSYFQLIPDYKMDVFILLYDTNGDPFSVVRYNASTPSLNSSLGTATLTLANSDVTTTTATYTIDVDATTFGYFHTIYPDYSIEGIELTDTAVQALVSGREWIYMKESADPRTFTVNLPAHWGNTVPKSYYIIAYPVNANGKQGWGTYSMTKISAPTE